MVTGHYPERPQEPSNWLAETTHLLAGAIKGGGYKGSTFRRILTEIHRYSKVFANATDDELKEKRRDLQRHLHRYGFADELVYQSFALIREISGRTIQMRHFDCQLTGGWIMVKGGLAEMETGEGKTLTAVLAAATAALAGIPVHVITVNDYLVARDAEQMGPVYRKLGLSVGVVTEEQDTAARQAAYRCDITYCTNKQLAFDYLRDRILLGNDQGRMRLQLEQLHYPSARTRRLFLRGLCFAIIDEADSILIDEARTPLIISQEHSDEQEEQTYHQAMKLASMLDKGTDFLVEINEHQIHITAEGSARLASAAENLRGLWKGTRWREELVTQALSACNLYQRDRHYLVRDDTVQIIDANTGRIMADRSWERGLHQMIEIKENCPLTGRREHLARLTYQRFFRRYLHLAGMTGTAREVRHELWSVYHLSVIKVPTNKPSRRVALGQKIYRTKEEKWKRVLEQIRAMQKHERPVLVGTGSVADSELLSELLHQAGLAHQILNARQDGDEARIVADAGEKGCITVATNMAGRGTDIPLGPGVAKIGGLHVICTQKNEAKRIDRQLYGRCGRQGDPGSYETILSLNDDMIRNYFSPFFHQQLVRLTHPQGVSAPSLATYAMWLAQRATERRHRRMRSDLRQMDEQLSRILAFTGRME